MVQRFANHPDNPYHCGDGYGAPGWRFGALASEAMGAAPEPVGEGAADEATQQTRRIAGHLPGEYGRALGGHRRACRAAPVGTAGLAPALERLPVALFTQHHRA